MKTLPLVGCFGIILAGAALLRQPAVEPVPVRELLNNKDKYDGRKVTVRTAGFQPAPDRGRIHYRRFAGDPPVLVAVYSGAAPAVMPAAVRGTFRSGNPATLEDCTAVTASP